VTLFDYADRHPYIALVCFVWIGVCLPLLYFQNK